MSYSPCISTFRALSRAPGRACFAVLLLHRLQRPFFQQLIPSTRVLSAWLAALIVPTAPGLGVPLCKEVLVRAFPLDVAKLLYKRETNRTFLALLAVGLGSIQCDSSLLRHRIFSQVEFWRKHQQWTGDSQKFLQ